MAEREPFISLVLPAYQEEKRIGLTVSSLSSYLQAKHPGTELIVVSDGCTDRTVQVARENFHAPDCTLRIVELPVNGGKGNAVKAGMDAARGRYVMFTDADLSFAPECVDLFLEKLRDGADVVIAQRNKKEVYEGLGRRIVAMTSRFIVGNIVLPGIRDTQAGFKAYKSEVGKYLYSRLQTGRFLFDLEILLMAKRKSLRVEKVYVDWIDRPGSTVSLFRDTTRSGAELLLILLMFWLFSDCYQLDEPVPAALPAHADLDEKPAAGETRVDGQAETHATDDGTAVASVTTGKADPGAERSDSQVKDSTEKAGMTPWFFITRTLAGFVLILPIVAILAAPGSLVQTSDYETAFYAAASAVAHGKPLLMYPQPTDNSFISSGFNQFAHSVLPDMPKGSIAIYMYAPCVAMLMAPLSLLPPTASYMVWQLISIAAVVVSAWLIGSRNKRLAGDIVCCTFLFLPVFHTILIGQLGLVFGLLPASIGTYLMLNKKHFAAGLVWSLLLLKPQFLPFALLVCGAQFLNKRWASAVGLAAGATAIGLFLKLACPDLLVAWLHSFRLSDTIFTDPRYSYPKYMVTCLPGAVVQLLPLGMMGIAKTIMYGVAGAIGLTSLWLAWRLLAERSSAEENDRGLTYVLLLAVLVLPLVVPHMLSYDLCFVPLAAFVAMTANWNKGERFAMFINIAVMGVVIDIYFFLSGLKMFGQSLIFTLIYAVAYLKLFQAALKFANTAKPTTLHAVEIKPVEI